MRKRFERKVWASGKQIEVYGCLGPERKMAPAPADACLEINLGRGEKRKNLENRNKSGWRTRKNCIAFEG